MGAFQNHLHALYGLPGGLKQIPVVPPVTPPVDPIIATSGAGYDPPKSHQPYKKKVEDIEEFARREILREKKRSRKKVYEIHQTRKGPVAKRVALWKTEPLKNKSPREDRVLVVNSEEITRKTRELAQVERQLETAKLAKTKAEQIARSVRAKRAADLRVLEQKAEEARLAKVQAEEDDKVFRAKVVAALDKRREALYRRREAQIVAAVRAREEALALIEKKKKEQQEIEESLAIMLLLGY